MGHRGANSCYHYTRSAGIRLCISSIASGRVHGKEAEGQRQQLCRSNREICCEPTPRFPHVTMCPLWIYCYRPNWCQLQRDSDMRSTRTYEDLAVVLFGSTPKLSDSKLTSESEATTAASLPSSRTHTKLTVLTVGGERTLVLCFSP
jgi:hypothetical protein